MFGWQFERALEQAVKKRQTLAVIYVHFDDFKRVNDEHGHHAGDALLKTVAARITQSLRADDMVGRIEEVEFACLLPNVPSCGRLNHIARKFFDAVAGPLIIGRCVTVRPRLGIVRFPVDGATADEMLGKTDAAMRHAKRRESEYAFFLT